MSFPKRRTGNPCPEIAYCMMEPGHLKTEAEIDVGVLLLQDKNAYPLQP